MWYLGRFVLVAVWLFASIARASDLDAIYSRQVDIILSEIDTSKDEIEGFIKHLLPDGTWSTINYESGCDSRRSSWPAGAHWLHILKMAAAYRGAIPQYTNNAELRSGIRNAMRFWFENDYETLGDGSCMDRQYVKGSCPCGTRGLWGLNWYSNVIQIPTRSTKTCLLLRSELTRTELGNCTRIGSRAYAPFYRNPLPEYLTGANVIDVAAVGINVGLLENDRQGNMSRIADAYNHVHDQIVVELKDRVDGIKADGSFQQHDGVIYNGNYGKDFSNAVLELELQAMATQFQANKSVQDVFGMYLAGSRWMTYTNTLTKVVHWDLSVIGRYIAYPVSDLRASADLRMNLSQVSRLGTAWGQTDLLEFASQLTGKDDTTANSGNLTGTRMYWNSDYFIHRSPKAVTTLKMLSSRTNTECVNFENPFGFHFSDGVTYRYSTGAEYEDMFATLDYNIPPGITTDYGATPLRCARASVPGVDTYAGGVQAYNVGAAAMRYINPLTKSFGFYKAWFFFPDDIQHVLVTNVQQSKGDSTAPVYSVLDQRLRLGDVYINGQKISKSGSYNSARYIWHAGTGFVFPRRSTKIALRLETKSGSWANISKSLAPPSTKDMFAAWIVHDSSRGKDSSNLVSNPTFHAPAEYSVFLGSPSVSAFAKIAARNEPRTVVNSAVVSAATDASAMTFGAAFWNSFGGDVTVPMLGMKIEVDRGVILVLQFADQQRNKALLSIADPTHGTGQVKVKITHVGSVKGGAFRKCTSSKKKAIEVSFDLPEGAAAGSTVEKDVDDSQC